MVNYFLPEVDVSGISGEVLGKIQEEFSQRISDIMKSSEDISQITNKIQNISTLFVFILEFYKFAGNKVFFTLGELIQLANLFPYSFQRKQFEPFMRILNSPLDFQEKIKRLRELLALSVNLSMNEIARVITLCDDFHERLAFLHSMYGQEGEIHKDDLWYIFRGKGVTLDSLEALKRRILDEQLTRYDGLLRNMHKVHGVTSAEREKRKELFRSLENVLSPEQIQEVIEERDISYEKLQRILEIFRKRYKELSGNFENAHKGIISLSRKGDDFTGYTIWDNVKKKSIFHEVDINNMSTEEFKYIFTTYGVIDDFPF